jgi:hypothetical protein
LAETTSINKLLDNSIRGSDDVLQALESFISVYKEKKQKTSVPSIPLSLFSNRKLGSLEVVVKFMKENLSLNFNQIASIIKRDPRTIWCTYSAATSKNKELFKIKKEKYNIPFEIFSNRKQGPLEAVVCHLKDNLNLSFNQISGLLNRDYNTIWLSYKNGKKHDK